MIITTIFWRKEKREEEKKRGKNEAIERKTKTKLDGESTFLMLMKLNSK